MSEVRLTKAALTNQLRRTVVDRGGRWQYVTLFNTPDPEFTTVVNTDDNLRISTHVERDDIEFRTTRITASGQALVTNIAVNRARFFKEISQNSDDVAREMHKAAREVLEKEKPRQTSDTTNWLRTANADAWNAFNQAKTKEEKRLVIRKLTETLDTLKERL